MLAIAFSAAMLGIEGYVVRVEADSSPGTPGLSIIGLPDRALREASSRVRSAIFNSGFAYPAGKLLVNLAPADVHKAGPAFDLAIALALLGLDEQLDRLAVQDFIALGELALDGRLAPVNGILPMVLGARCAGFSKLIVPESNASEAALVDGMELYVVDSLQSATAVVANNGARWRRHTKAPLLDLDEETVHGDIADVRGQIAAKRALEIAAAAVTTFCSSVHPVAARRCSRAVCHPSYRRCRCTRHLRSRRSIASPDYLPAMPESSAPARSVFHTIRFLRPRWLEGVRSQSQGKFRSRIMASYSLTSFPNFRAAQLKS